MGIGRRTWAYALAAVGSTGLIVTLWLPWYSFQIPAGILDQAERIGQQFGILGPLVREGAAILRTYGPLHVTAWQVFHQVDIVLVVAATAAGSLALLAYTGRATGVARIIALVAGVALGVAAYRVVVPPGPSGALHPAWGAYVALLCAATVVVAALIAGAEEAREVWRPLDPPILDQPAQWPTAGSVAPPGIGS